MSFQISEIAPAEEARPKQRRTHARRERKPSARYMTLVECGAHFCVDPSTIRKGTGVFNQLELVQPTPHRTLVLRASVEKLDRKLERMARSVVQIEDHKETAASAA